MLELLTSRHPVDPPGGGDVEMSTVDHHRRENRWLRGSLDSIDYPMLCVAPDHTVCLINRAARRELADPGHPLRLQGDALDVRQAGAAPALHRALREALTLGFRRLVVLGEPPSQLSVAVLPLGIVDDDAGALLLFGRRRLCETLSADWYARERGLTGTEARVLQGLTGGLGLREIARSHGVALSTIRTHVRSVRAKTGTASIRDLLSQVSSLPPILARSV